MADSRELLGDHKVHRGLYRLGIDRNDAKYMTVKAKLVKNGDLYFTNFSARLSSIDDGAYEPNPDDLNQQILKQNTKIEQNAKEVAIKANSVDVTRDIKSAVDGIKVGTSNLLHHSDTFEGWHKGSTVSIAGSKYLNGTVAILAPGGSGGNALNADLDGPYDNQPVTWTVWAKADNAGDKLHTELWGGGGYDDQPLTTEWQVYKFTGQRDARDHSLYLWGCQGNKGKVYVALPFAVIGNAIGTWTPNAGDTSEEIKSAKDAAIQVASDQINLHVNEISTQFDDKLNKRVNEVKTASEKFTSDGIEQVVTKVTNVKGDVDALGDKVDGISVGTSNLLHNSDTFDGWIRGASTNISGKYLNGSVAILGGAGVNGGQISVGTSNLLHNSDTFDGWIRGASTNISGKYLNGSVAILGGAGVNGGQITTNLDGPNDNALLTWSVYAKADIAGDKFHTELWGGGGSTDQPLTTDWKLYKFSGRRNANHPDFYLWGIIGNKGNIYVSLPVAVIGNTIGSWTPNSEDINKKIDTQVLDSANINDMKTQGHYFVKTLPVAVIGNTIGSWTPNSEDINKKIDTQVLDSANINDMKTQGHYFVKNLTGNPLAGWVYVDVMGFDGRIRQDVYQDGDSKHMYRRLFGSNWSNWEQGAYISDVNNVKTEVTASVKNLGDRVITQVNSVETKVDNLSVGGRSVS